MSSIINSAGPVNVRRPSTTSPDDLERVGGDGQGGHEPPAHVRTRLLGAGGRWGRPRAPRPGRGRRPGRRAWSRGRRRPRRPRSAGPGRNGSSEPTAPGNRPGMRRRGPNGSGHRSASPSTGPAKVPRFQKIPVPMPVTRNPRRARAASGWAAPTPVDSSMTSCDEPETDGQRPAEPPGHDGSVQHVAGGEERGRPEGGERIAPGAEHAHDGELAGAGEHEQRHRLGLPGRRSRRLWRTRRR